MSVIASTILVPGLKAHDAVIVVILLRFGASCALKSVVVYLSETLRCFGGLAAATTMSLPLYGLTRRTEHADCLV